MLLVTHWLGRFPQWIEYHLGLIMFDKAPICRRTVAWANLSWIFRLKTSYCRRQTIVRSTPDALIIGHAHSHLPGFEWAWPATPTLICPDLSGRGRPRPLSFARIWVGVAATPRFHWSFGKKKESKWAPNTIPAFPKLENEEMDVKNASETSKIKASGQNHTSWQSFRLG